MNDELRAFKVLAERLSKTQVAQGVVLSVSTTIVSVQMEGSNEVKTYPKLRGVDMQVGDMAVLLNIHGRWVALGSYGV